MKILNKILPAIILTVSCILCCLSVIEVGFESDIDPVFKSLATLFMIIGFTVVSVYMAHLAHQATSKSK